MALKLCQPPASIRPKPGYVIGTGPSSGFSLRSWHLLRTWLVGKGIQGFQLLRGYKAPGRLLVHIVGYVGALDPDEIRLATGDGRVAKVAAAAGRSEAEEIARLGARKDFSFSMTWPVGCWESWQEIQLNRPRYVLLRPCDVRMRSRKVLEARARVLWEFYGRHYDEWQLGGILLAGIVDEPIEAYQGWIDRGAEFNVCSGTEAGAWEQARLAYGLTGQEPWKRLFGGMHIERVPPAAFAGPPSWGKWDPEFQIIDSKV